MPIEGLIGVKDHYCQGFEEQILTKNASSLAGLSWLGKGSVACSSIGLSLNRGALEDLSCQNHRQAKALSS